MPDHTLYMRRCIELAQLAKGNTMPNPMVGAVLVHDRRIIGEGWHRQYGQAHAEVNCLESVVEADKHLVPHSTMYVNLEPCAHHGKTPPCAVRLVQEQVKEVVIANVDPFEKVGGKGIEILKAHGIAVQAGVLEHDGAWINRRFFCFHRQQRPYIILKWAQTKSGFFAPVNRTRFQLSNEHSKQLLHKWRTEEAAIMVGYNTALGDDPQLTARLWPGKQPLRIVLDRQLQLPQSLRVFNADAPTWIINAIKDEEADGKRYVKLPFDGDLLRAITNKLHEANILSLIVEGGAQLLHSFIKESLWDEARIFTVRTDMKEGVSAPLLANATSAFTTPVGNDVLSVYIHNASAYPYPAGMEL